MQHAVLLGRDSWIRFNTRSNPSFPPRPSDQRVFGELTLSDHAPTGASAFVPDPLASGGSFHLRYDGADGVTWSDEPQLLAVNLVRSNGLPALTGHYLVEMLPQPDLLLAQKHFAASGRQVLPTSGATDLEPGGLLGDAHAPLMRAPIAAFQSTNSAPAVSPPTTSPALLERLTPEQSVSFLRVRHRLPRNLHEVSFD